MPAVQLVQQPTGRHVANGDGDHPSLLPAIIVLLMLLLLILPLLLLLPLTPLVMLLLLLAASDASNAAVQFAILFCFTMIVPRPRPRT